MKPCQVALRTFSTVFFFVLDAGKMLSWSHLAPWVFVVRLLYDDQNNVGHARGARCMQWNEMMWFILSLQNQKRQS